MPHLANSELPVIDSHGTAVETVIITHLNVRPSPESPSRHGGAPRAGSQPGTLPDGGVQSLLTN